MNNIKIVNTKKIILFFAFSLLISLYKSHKYLKKNYSGAVWFITNVDVLHIIIITNHGAYRTNGSKVCIFYLSGTILNVSGLWEINGVYCNPRAIYETIIQRTTANSGKME